MPDAEKDPKALKRLPRDELNDVAEEAGVPNPDDLPNKEAVVEAIEGPNPALAPVPDTAEQGEKSYQVIGPHVVLGHKPGEKFAATIAPDSEALLIESGHLKIIKKED